MIQGIDISRWQTDINWEKVKGDGIEFAIIRACNGLTKDKCFEEHMNSAAAVGIDTGVYCFARADTVQKAEAEAEFVLSLIKNHRLTYPVCYDMESTELMALDNTSRTDVGSAFCEKIENAGYYAMIYTNKDWLENRLEYDRLKRFDIWLAQWRSSPTWEGTFGIWQLGLGKVDGIGDCDRNVSYRNYPEIIEKAKLNHLDEKKLAVGDRVRYSGVLFTASDGEEAAASADGIFTIREIVEGEKNGVLLEVSGWASQQDVEIL
jgi:GH25 family lysozyme M1 (1,4-beta-N-acetylmuramidase)